MARHRKLRRSSENYAVWYLENNGYTVVDTNVPLLIDDVEVSDIDIIAEKDGNIYAVEVKAGQIDVNAVRQASVNARLAGYKPMIIGRGIDDKAEAVAKELGVYYIVLPDMLYAGFEELREAVKEAIYEIIDELVVNIDCEKAKEEKEIILALSNSLSFKEFADKLNLSVEEAIEELKKLKEKGIIPKTSFKLANARARIIRLICNLNSK